ncbi:MAG: hypothetical protein SFY32_11070 [Bacteroidota bacterium]|nr:hypothetical protein [Bacteroidota bacterium]
MKLSLISDTVVLFKRYFFIIIPALIYFHTASKFSNWRIDGDEPHYIITGISIWEDGDMNVKNNYENEEIRQQFYGKMDWHAHENTEYRIFRSTLIPILTIIPFQLFGISGVKFFFAFLISFMPIVIFLILKEFDIGLNYSKWISFIISTSLPYTYVCDMIYGDLVFGLICIYILYVLLRFQYNKSSRIEIVAALLLIFLVVFIHIRFLPVSIGFFIIFWFSNLLKQQNWKSSSYLFIILIFVSFILFRYVNYMQLGFESPNAIIFDIKKSAMLLLMYHFDVSSGLFFVNPILIFGLFGLLPLYKFNKRFFVSVAFIYSLIIIPTLLIVDQYHLSGLTTTRYTWCYSLIWVFPIGCFFYEIINKFKISMSFIFGVTIAFNLSMYFTIIEFNRGEIIWNKPINTFFVPIRHLLPIFKNPENWYLSSHNLFILTIFLSMVFSGYFLIKNNFTRFINFIKILFSSILIYMTLIIVVPKSFEIYYTTNWIFKPKTLITSPINKPSTIFESLSLDSLAGVGLMTSGPYIYLNPGKYVLQACFDTLNVMRYNSIGHVNICNRGIFVSRFDLEKDKININNNQVCFTKEFSIYEINGAIEFQLFKTIKDGLILNYFKLKMTDNIDPNEVRFIKESIHTDFIKNEQNDSIGYTTYQSNPLKLSSGIYQFENIKLNEAYIFTEGNLLSKINNSSDSIFISSLSNSITIHISNFEPINVEKIKILRIGNFLKMPSEHSLSLDCRLFERKHGHDLVEGKNVVYKIDEFVTNDFIMTSKSVKLSKGKYKINVHIEAARPTAFNVEVISNANLISIINIDKNREINTYENEFEIKNDSDIIQVRIFGNNIKNFKFKNIELIGF